MRHLRRPFSGNGEVLEGERVTHEETPSGSEPLERSNTEAAATTDTAATDSPIPISDPRTSAASSSEPDIIYLGSFPGPQSQVPVAPSRGTLARSPPRMRSATHSLTLTLLQDAVREQDVLVRQLQGELEAANEQARRNANAAEESNELRIQLIEKSRQLAEAQCEISRLEGDEDNGIISDLASVQQSRQFDELNRNMAEQHLEHFNESRDSAQLDDSNSPATSCKRVADDIRGLGETIAAYNIKKDVRLVKAAVLQMQDGNATMADKLEKMSNDFEACKMAWARLDNFLMELAPGSAGTPLRDYAESAAAGEMKGKCDGGSAPPPPPASLLPQHSMKTRSRSRKKVGSQQQEDQEEDEVGSKRQRTSSPTAADPEDERNEDDGPASSNQVSSPDQDIFFNPFWSDE